MSDERIEIIKRQVQAMCGLLTDLCIRVMTNTPENWVSVMHDTTDALINLSSLPEAIHAINQDTGKNAELGVSYILPLKNQIDNISGYMRTLIIAPNESKKLYCLIDLVRMINGLPAFVDAALPVEVHEEETEEKKDE